MRGKHTHTSELDAESECESVNPIWPEGDPNIHHMCITHARSCSRELLRKPFPSWCPSFAAYLASGRRECAVWRRSVPERALLLTAVQLDQVAALWVAGEFTVWREETRGSGARLPEKNLGRLHLAPRGKGTRERSGGWESTLRRSLCAPRRYKWRPLTSAAAKILHVWFQVDAIK